MKTHDSHPDFEIIARALPELAAICRGAASTADLAERLRAQGFTLPDEEVAALHAAACELGDSELDGIAAGFQPGDPEHDWWVRTNSRRNLRNS